ncbi:LGFP repeat-containing protein [Corynebacterium sp. CCM 9204]|uniref:LGFP repeat-containing protein n=1 Tax=Corynebacterium sp. CCM 9204 TaxID=3057616 RepID=UPI003524982D
MQKPGRFSTILGTPLLSITLLPQSNAAPSHFSFTEENGAELSVQPRADNLKPTEPGFDKNEISNSSGEGWHPTDNPNPELRPGEMRSDRESIPGGFTKEEADRAEMQEASEKLSMQHGRRVKRSEPVNCRTYWPSPYKVCGAIREKYDSLGGPSSFLTWPKSDELGVPDGVGRRNEFINGFIYWHPETGAHSVTTHFSVVWARNGWEAGDMGYPTSDEYGLPDGTGRKQDFQRSHIYGSLQGLASISGEIYDRWQELGGEHGPLQYPTGDQTKTPDGVGKFNRFFGGMIYSHPSFGAHEIMGLPLLIWSARGYENSEWGYPTDSPTQDTEAPILTKQSFSKKKMDTRRLIAESGDSSVIGKEVNNLVIELLEANGIHVPKDNPYGYREENTRLKRALSRCPLPDSSQKHYGGVSIPFNYDYWGCIDEAKSWEHYGRHDYCTHSPNQYPAIGQNAEFSGACARHDICMDRADRNGQGYWDCNERLYQDMEKVCSNVYTAVDPRHYNCRDFRDAYWLAVTGTHLDNL